MSNCVWYISIKFIQLSTEYVEGYSMNNTLAGCVKYVIITIFALQKAYTAFL